MTSAAVTEAELTRHDVDASWAEWAGGADLADEPEVALALFAARPTDHDGPAELEGAAFDTARLELMAGRPERALNVLARIGLVEVPAAPAQDPRTALLAACRAATGDAQAYRWLLAGLRNVDWAGSWSAVYLVAVAARARHDLATVDEMWTRAVTVHGIRTRYSLRQAAVAAVSRRDREDVGAACAALAEAADLLDGVAGGTAGDPGVVLEAVTELRDRGDHSGALLLLQAVERCTPSHGSVADELERVLPVRSLRRRSHATLLGGLAAFVLGLAAGAVSPVLSVTSVVGALVIVAQLLRQEHARLPGLDKTGTAVFRALDGVEQRLAPGAGPAGGVLSWVQPVGYQRAGYWAAAIASLFPAMALAAVIGDAAGGDPDGMLAGSIFLGVPAICSVTAFVGTRRLHRRALHRRRAAERSALHRARSRGMSRCACFETPVVTGPFVGELLRSHLRIVGPDTASAAAVAGRLGGAADLAFCPTTGHLWLAPSHPDGQPLLLRGAVASGVTTHETQAGTPLTGFYL